MQRCCHRKKQLVIYRFPIPQIDGESAVKHNLKIDIKCHFSIHITFT